MTSVESFHMKYGGCYEDGILQFSRGNIGADAITLAKVLANARQQHRPQTFTGLDLDCHSIGDEGVMELARQALPKLPHLTKLSLSGNCIGLGGVQALAEVLPQLSRLEVLDLSKNSVGNDGLKVLARVLPQSPQLTDLYLSYNAIGDEGIEALADVLPQLPQLTYLELRYNSIGNEGVSALARSSSSDGERSSPDRAGGTMEERAGQTVPANNGSSLCCSLEEPFLGMLRVMESC